MTPVSDDFSSCCLHPAVYHGVFQHVFMCVCLSLLVLPLPLPFSYYCISIFATGCQASLQPCGFVALSITFSSLGSPRPSLSISNHLPYVCAVCLCAAANSFPLRQTANCCCKEYSSPLLLLLFCAPPTERMICAILLKQMITCM